VHRSSQAQARSALHPISAAQPIPTRKARVKCTGSEVGANTNLESDEADEDACDEETKGDEEPDDAPHFAELLESQEKKCEGEVYLEKGSTRRSSRTQTRRTSSLCARWCRLTQHN
jgi:hypothetical protein